MPSEPEVTAKKNSVGESPVDTDMSTNLLPGLSNNAGGCLDSVDLIMKPGLKRESLARVIGDLITIPGTTHLTILDSVPETPLAATTAGILLHDFEGRSISVEELQNRRIFAVLDTRSDGLKELQEAINTVSSGRIYISIATFENLDLHSRQQSLANYREQSRLSRRELEVAALVAERKSNKEIAKELHIEVATVKNHVVNARSKLGISEGRAALADWYKSHAEQQD